MGFASRQMSHQTKGQWNRCSQRASDPDPALEGAFGHRQPEQMGDLSLWRGYPVFPPHCGPGILKLWDLAQCIKSHRHLCKTIGHHGMFGLCVVPEAAGVSRALCHRAGVGGAGQRNLTSLLYEFSWFPPVSCDVMGCDCSCSSSSPSLLLQLLPPPPPH